MQYDDDRPSKQQLKRDAEAAQVLGTALAELAGTQLRELFDKVDLPDKLHAALIEYGRLKAREARRRQLQYIGKLMRGVEPEPIQDFLAQLQHNRQAASAQHHQLEQWRDRLLHEGEPACEALLRDYPQADAGQVRQLVSQSQREAAHNQPPRAARLLFRYLRTLMGDSGPSG